MNSDDLFQTLETEFKELIEKIESDVLELENSQSPEIINSIFRAIHTIKGNSAMVGMDRLRDISHCLETLFSRLRSGEIKLETEMIEIILKSIDRMKEMILDLKNEAKYEVKDLIFVLEKFLNKDSSTSKNNSESVKEEYSHFIEIAKNEKKFLYLVDIDFGVNPHLTLNQWIQKMNSLESNILKKGIRVEDISNLSSGQISYTLPYSILLLTQEKPEIFLENQEIPFNKINVLYSAEKKIGETKSNQESIRANSYLKVPTKIIDDLINLAGEAVIARNQLAQSLVLEEDSEEEIRMNRVSQFINNIYNRLMKVRLQKLGLVFPRLQRVVRDASTSVGKEIRMHLEGADIELDEVVIEGITESLLHIIRNSIDHGIETAADRITQGKNSYGEIFFKASLTGGNIIIEIKDDGRGLNFERIKKKALEKHLISQEDIMQLSDEDIADLIFLPGFSTSEQITEVSGRGVGMDVVFTNFKKFGGSVKIKTEFGKGMTILGIIPQTLSVMPAFIISVFGNKFAILQKHIVELNKYNPENILLLDNRKIYKREEKLIPIIELREMLFPEKEKQNECENIAIIKSAENLFAISFDHLISIEEIVLKPVPDQLKKIEIFGGTTLSGDGSAILLLEPEGIVKFSKLQLEKSEPLGSELKREKIINENYLAFETSDQFFLTHASDILFVSQIQKEQIQFVFGKEMIQLDGVLIPAFRLETFFNMELFDNRDNMLCLSIQVGQTNIGVLVHSLIDILNFVELKENNAIQNEYVEGVCFIENKNALYINIPRILDKIKVEVS